MFNNDMMFYLVSQQMEYFTMFKFYFNYEKYLEYISNDNVKRCFFSVQNIIASFRD